MNEGPVSTGKLRIVHRGRLIERLVGSGHQVQRGHVRPGAGHDVLVIARSDLLSTCEKFLSEPQRQGLTFLAEFSGRHTSGRRRAVGAGQHEARFKRLWPVASAPPKTPREYYDNSYSRVFVALVVEAMPHAKKLWDEKARPAIEARRAEATHDAKLLWDEKARQLIERRRERKAAGKTIKAAAKAAHRG